MGSMQFLVPRREGVRQLVEQCAYMVGHDGAPWETQVSGSDCQLTVSRDARESGRLITPWTVPGFGSMALSTATLVPRDEPYHLGLELSRGTLSRIHGQVSCQLLERPRVGSTLDSAQEHFIRAALNQDDIEESARQADMSLSLCMDVIRQCLGEAARSTPAPPAFSSRLTGVQLRGPGDFEVLRQQKKWPGNAIFYQGSWREAEPNPGDLDFSDWITVLEQMRKARRRVVCGPLFRLVRQDLPDWLYLWDDDFDVLQSYVCAYIRAAVDQLSQRVHVWYVTSGTNVDSELRLGEEQRLRLTLAAIESLRQSDGQTPAIVGIKQPWGEYLGRSTADLAPLQFADIVVRSGLGISGFALEMDFACDRQRSLPRDLLELNRTIDEWSRFGLPLVVLLSMATDSPQGTADPVLGQNIRDTLGLLQQKSSVQGIIWSQLCDRPDSQGGLIDISGETTSTWTFVADSWKSKRP